METKHTPTPWKAEKGRTVMHVTGQHFGVCQISTTGYRGDTPEDKRMYAERAEANAAFIVRAVNAHDELVAALEDVRAYAADFTHGDRLVQEMVSGIFSRADRTLRALARVTPPQQISDLAKKDGQP